MEPGMERNQLGCHILTTVLIIKVAYAPIDFVLLFHSVPGFIGTPLPSISGIMTPQQSTADCIQVTCTPPCGVA